MHLEDETVERLAHGELVAPDERAARAHIASCGACAARVNAARHDDVRIGSLLATLDAPMPRVRAVDVMSRPAAAARRPRHYRAAAAILLALALGGVAWAAPGSPIRRWLEAGAEREIPRTAAPPPRPSVPAASSSGIAVAPGERFAIAFVNASGLVDVALADSGELRVQASQGAATFASEVNRLVVSNAPGARIEVTIPRHAAHVEIRVADRRVFLVQRGRATTDARPAAGRWVVDLSARQAPDR